MVKFEPNSGKKLIIEVDGEKWARYPVRTHFITEKDSLEKIFQEYVLPYLKNSDILVFGQKIV